MKPCHDLPDPDPDRDPDPDPDAQLDPDPDPHPYLGPQPYPDPDASRASVLASILRRDGNRMRILSIVQARRLPDCWVGAGFVRNAVWDALAGRPPAPVSEDIDVVWFDPARCDAASDRRIERDLAARDPGLRWSVKNQHRMHIRNADAPYRCCEDALRHWPETATAVAVRLAHGGRIEVLAPFGLQDLFAGIVRPTPAFAFDGRLPRAGQAVSTAAVSPVSGKRAVFEARWREKRWLERWPFLRIVAPQ
jgi:hypothetical protein